MTYRTHRRLAWLVLAFIFVMMFVLQNAQAADTKISALPAAAAIAGTEAVPVVQSAATVRTTPTALALWTLTGSSTLTVGPVGTNTVLVGNAAPSTLNAGNGLIMRAGPGGTTQGSGGNVEIAGGIPVDGVGGTAIVRATAGVGTNRAGGAASVLAGSGSGTATGGAGVLTAGIGGLTGAGGPITITAGLGGATSGAGGAATVSGGIAQTDGNGGGVSIVGRNGVGTNRNGGDVTITTGTATGSGTAGVFIVNGTTVFATNTGTFTYNLSCATPATNTYTLNRSGNIVTLRLGGNISCTSDNASFLTNTAPIPAAFRPSAGNTSYPGTAITDNGTAKQGCFRVFSTGDLGYGTFDGNGACQTGSWTASGTKAANLSLGSSTYTWSVN